MLKAVSLFSGCGGSDLGLHGAGFEIILANDIHPYARDFYEANLPETDFKLMDIRELTSFPDADILVGCYPCQGFSQGGARKANRKINFLYREFSRALRQIKPKAFIVENVSGMRRSDFRHLLQNQIIQFRLAGYRVKWSVLHAEDFGVPQERRRLFIVGVRSDFGVSFEFPKRKFTKEGGGHMTIREAIGHLPDWPEGKFYAESFHWYYMSRNRRRSWDEPSKTIVAGARHVGLHPISPKMKRIEPDKWVFENERPARRFSYEECALLQGFRKNVHFPETASMLEKYKVIGNAVPPPLFEAVARNLPKIW